MKANKRGVSLIVLVITIIIMIIIAGAIILALNGSGILGRANKAKTVTDIAGVKQAATMALAEYKLLVNSNDSSVQGKTDISYVQEKLAEQGLNEYSVAIVDERIIVGSGASAINSGVVFGDYVAYIPIVKTSVTYKVGQTDTYFVTQSGENSVGWRYMGIDEEGNAMLIADRPTNSELYLGGTQGFAQGPTDLNSLCKELYSSSLGDARSINVEDVNNVLGAKPVGEYVSKTGETLKNTENLTIGQLVSQKGETPLAGTYSPISGKTINDYISDNYGYVGTAFKAKTTDEYKLMFRDLEDKSNIKYWLASTSVCAYFDTGRSFANFHLRYVDYAQVRSFFATRTKYTNFCASYPVRPIVTLKYNVKFGTKTNDVWSIS